MTLVNALERSYAEGMGCSALDETDESVYFLRKDGAGKYVVWIASPANVRCKHRDNWVEPGSPLTLAGLTAEYEVVALPPFVEPDFRPLPVGAPQRIEDLL